MFRSTRVSFEPGIDPLRLDADRSAASDACVMQLAPLAGSVDRVAAHTGVFGALGNGQPGLHGPSARALAGPETSCNGDYAPRRAGDVAGAVPVGGAGADMMPAPD